MDPVRRMGGSGLLVEERPSAPSGMRFIVSGRPCEMGADQVGDVPVVREEVALRVSLVRPEDLVQVGEAEVASVDLDPPRVPVLPGLERFRQLEREGGTG